MMMCFDATMMKAYVAQACKDCVANGAVIELASIPYSLGYHDGAVVAPLGFETDEFCGAWFVWLGLALGGRFIIRRLDLGQARFRFTCEGEVQHPEGVRPNTAEVRRDGLIEALDQRFGPDRVNIAPRTEIEARQICQRLWPCEVLPHRLTKGR
jgi:hypothetical protein